MRNPAVRAAVQRVLDIIAEHEQRQRDRRRYADIGSQNGRSAEARIAALEALAADIESEFDDGG